MEIIIKRETRESKILVKINDKKRNKNIKEKINTPINFFNHMIETLSHRMCLNIEVDVKLDKFYLSHVICEDVGICLGKALLEMISKKSINGIEGSGSAVQIIDEALSRSVISYEDRALLDLDIDKRVKIKEKVEDMNSEDLIAFLEGFVQGSKATLHLDILKGKNEHHIWESAFRSLGEAIKNSLKECSYRKGITVGVLGKSRYEKKIK